MQLYFYMLLVRREQILRTPVCRTGKIVASWPVRTNNQSAKSFYVRLPPDQAAAAMKLLLGHAEFGLLSTSISV